jgi:hypothetical protein
MSATKRNTISGRTTRERSRETSWCLFLLPRRITGEEDRSEDDIFLSISLSLFRIFDLRCVYVDDVHFFPEVHTRITSNHTRAYTFKRCTISRPRSRPDAPWWRPLHRRRRPLVEEDDKTRREPSFPRVTDINNNNNNDDNKELRYLWIMR